MGIIAPRPENPPRVKKPNRKSPGGRPSLWTLHLEKIAAAGGEWMAAGEYVSPQSAQTTAQYVRRKHDPAGRFEFTSRTVDGKGVLYARLRTGAK